MFSLDSLVPEGRDLAQWQGRNEVAALDVERGILLFGVKRMPAAFA
jgi:hypothetical protein